MTRQLAERIRGALRGRDGVTERKMFGGIAFMVGGNMAVGVIRDDLMVRVGPDAHDEALAQPHVRVMDFAHRPMKGMIYVAPDGVATDPELDPLGRRRRRLRRDPAAQVDRPSRGRRRRLAADLDPAVPELVRREERVAVDDLAVPCRARRGSPSTSMPLAAYSVCSRSPCLSVETETVFVVAWRTLRRPAARRC